MQYIGKKIIDKIAHYKVLRSYGRNVGREGKENARGIYKRNITRISKVD